MIYLFIILLIIALYIYSQLTMFNLSYNLWCWKLNWNLKKNHLIYQSFFDKHNSYYKIKDSFILDENYMRLTLYFKDKVVTLTYAYENDFLEKPEHEIKSYTDEIKKILSQRNGWQMNRYLEDIKNANPFDENVEKTIDEMLAQSHRDWFSVDRPNLIAQLNQELNK